MRDAEHLAEGHFEAGDRDGIEEHAGAAEHALDDDDGEGGPGEFADPGAGFAQL